MLVVSDLEILFKEKTANYGFDKIGNKKTITMKDYQRWLRNNRQND